MHKSGGSAVAVTDDEILDAVKDWARDEGVFAAPEGAAALAAYRKLRHENFLREEDTVVLFNTGSGIKYVDVLASAFASEAGSPTRADVARGGVQARHIGGIIGPY